MVEYFSYKVIINFLILKILNMYIIIWILSFLVLILVHEFGHFISARKFWVKVHEFWLWIPPKIKTLHKDKKWTEYTLNALPLWGFVRPKWEDLSKDEEIFDKDSLHSKSIWQKIIILLSGVFINLILAFLIFLISFWVWIKPIFIIPDNSNNFKSESYLFPTNSFAEKVWYIKKLEPKPLKVNRVVRHEDMLASQIDIQTWDIIKSIWWTKVNNTNISTILKDFIWKEISIVINRNNKNISLNAKCPEDSCLLWISYSLNRTIQKNKMSFWESILWSLHEIKAQTILTFEWLRMLFDKIVQWESKKALDKLSWPVWAVAIWKFIMEIWMLEYLAFIWTISLALAIFNILPIPALDGWRVFSTILMHSFKLKPKKFLIVENYITLFFFVILLWLGFYIMYVDFVRFF